MGTHLINGQFQSDKYPTTPAGNVPLSVKDPTAQDLLWEYAQRRRVVDAEFSADLESALRVAGYTPEGLSAGGEQVRSHAVASEPHSDPIRDALVEALTLVEPFLTGSVPYPERDRLHTVVSNALSKAGR